MTQFAGIGGKAEKRGWGGEVGGGLVFPRYERLLPVRKFTTHPRKYHEFLPTT